MKTTNLLKPSFFLLVISGLFFGSGCSKNETTYAGLIRYSGDVAVDGCGWVIDMETGTYHPTNLATEFQQDSLHVDFSYKDISGSFNCGFGSSLKQIEITAMQKQ
jgi:hypothetical protein